MPLTLDSPLSLYSIPAVWLTYIYPSLWKFTSIANTIGFNNVHPRSNVSKILENKSVRPEIAARIARMEGAHLNGVENFPLWIAAVFAANYAGIDNRTLNTVSLAYVSLRVLYNQVYINHTKGSTSYVRTVIFFVATALALSLLLKAANKVYRESA